MNTPIKPVEAQYLTVGTLILPAGRKRPVEIVAIFDRPATVEVYGAGHNVFIFPRGEMVPAVAPKRVAA